MSKINNQQRKNLCTLVDARAKVAIAELNESSGDANMLDLVSKRLKKNKSYPALQKSYDALKKKRDKKVEDVNEKIAKLNEELKELGDEKDEVKRKIDAIGINPDTGIALHYSKRTFTTRNYRDPMYKITIHGTHEQIWKDIEEDFQEQKNYIVNGAVTTKEKIWLAETTEQAQNLIKDGSN